MIWWCRWIMRGLSSYVSYFIILLLVSLCCDLVLFFFSFFLFVFALLGLACVVFVMVNGIEARQLGVNLTIYMYLLMIINMIMLKMDFKIFILLFVYSINYYYYTILISHTITAIETIILLLMNVFYVDLTHITIVSDMNIKISKQSSIVQRAPEVPPKKENFIDGPRLHAWYCP